MNEERMLKPALTGGVLLGILSALPIINFFNCVCCAWVIGGGVLAAYMYVKDSPVPVTLGRGVGLGLATGLIGTIVCGLFSFPMYLIMYRRGRMGFAEQLRQTVEQLPNVPPETREALRALAERGGIDALILVFGLLFMFVIYSLFAMLGGAIGVAMFEKRKPGSPADASPYPPPPDLPPPPPDAP
jgi:hypothetical protein